ncbi:amino acid permease 3 isoform X1 [Selaginella moellendorffii]|uniref:amino acid permease 3 isoform X1 n=1 Tax=Selaginella moellendorffii TaxID=88036 RepID=UPI000D1C4688|nr:amino acid permease 3 isoform X1 [Selaginella moellendorffii]XP_024534714.1 amino acid permease 3 isoform X1 [Selaginella moellendorffii]XP_024534715.1 amino acid permease 3 isoform X1 [Selaginella moellendorffii]|eukprot:XP_002974163.2 amino acid permease 3 isoform X1 [Selaginella moellendorffii]
MFADFSCSTDKDHTFGSSFFCFSRGMKEADESALENGNAKHMDDAIPAVLLRTSSRDDDDDQWKRTGTVWTASAHVITAVIGSGVLSLAWSMAQLGWAVGPPVLLAFAFVTYYTSILLADCYRSPDPVTGKRNHTYQDAVAVTLGGAKVWICGIVQYTNLVGTAIGYTITASISMVAISRSDCFHRQGHDGPCFASDYPYMVVFGAVQILLSQIPDFDRIWWLSIAAAIMSFAYSFIGLGLGMARTFEPGHSYGTATGVRIGMGGLSQTRKIWQVFQSLGNVAFAYSFSMILIEIQDTLKSPPAENKTMKKATLVGVVTTTAFYMSVGCFGYAAFGNNAPGNLLTGFGFYEPFWLIDFANACIVIHLVGAYQVYCQPVFAYVEGHARSRWPKNKFVSHYFRIPIPLLGCYKFTLLTLVWRSAFVVVTTIVSMLLPFFNDVLGLLGAISFWPLTVYFPIEMYIKQRSIVRWSPKWIGLKALDLGCLLVSMAATLGSMEGIALSLKEYSPFKS